MYGLARFGAFWRTEATVSDTKKRPEKSVLSLTWVQKWVK